MIVMITGLPGTGKTTFGAALAAELGAAHLNTDAIRNELGKRGQYDSRTKQAIYQEMLRRAGSLLEEGRSVVIDGTFYRNSLRQSFADLAEARGKDIRWIELRAAEETVRRRVEAQRADSEADFAVYRKIKEQYEPINRAHLVLWSDQLSLREMVNRAKDFLMLPA